VAAESGPSRHPQADRPLERALRACDHPARLRRPLTIAAVALSLGLTTFVSAGSAGSSSRILDRNTRSETIRISGDQADITWRGGVGTGRVSLSGAIDALHPLDRNSDRRADRPQVKFRKDYSGQSMRSGGSCGRYTGPELPYVVAACTAADGTWWTLQRWERLKANSGGASAPAELWPSHFTSVAQFEGVRTIGEYVVGRYTFRGRPVHGFRSTSYGVPLDGYGRNVYLDLYDSALGPGWHRENSFLAQMRDGRFRHHLKSGKAARYRVCAIGPGVTPIVCHVWP
jgi:hypothetical protein